MLGRGVTFISRGLYRCCVVIVVRHTLEWIIWMGIGRIGWIELIPLMGLGMALGLGLPLIHVLSFSGLNRWRRDGARRMRGDGKGVGVGGIIE